MALHPDVLKKAQGYIDQTCKQTTSRSTRSQIHSTQTDSYGLLLRESSSSILTSAIRRSQYSASADAYAPVASWHTSRSASRSLPSSLISKSKDANGKPMAPRTKFTPGCMRYNSCPSCIMVAIDCADARWGSFPVPFSCDIRPRSGEHERLV